MKLPLSWIAEWVDVPWPRAELAHRLTMAGFEIEAIETTADGDSLLEINVTPNRGDAMSVLGIARELAALAGVAITQPALPAENAHAGYTAHQSIAAASDSMRVELEAPQACPKFVGQIVRGIDSGAISPQWLRRRLEACGLRSISAVVDVTNYILLELGQPMHAYDAAALKGEITARLAREGEHLVLLDDREVALTRDMLVIADDLGAVGLAGIMGGKRTAVSDRTTDVFLEVAWFEPRAISGRARRLGLQTDASQRFERGVDPEGQQRAMERATQLLLAIAGGHAGGARVTEVPDQLPKRVPIELQLTQLTRLLGIPLTSAQVDGAFGALALAFDRHGDSWTVTPPPYRFDLAISADLIEEVARVVGFEAIGERYADAAQRFAPLREEHPTERAFLEALANRGYQEAITFAFVDPALQERMFPGVAALTLANPISSELAQMRVSLWPGLVRAVSENLRRQQDRVRVFEHGVKFVDGAATREIDVIAGACSGLRLPEQWGVVREPFDFFDIKADVEALLTATGAREEFTFEPVMLSALHPGRSARILRQGTPVGWVGELHPAMVRSLDLAHPVLLFEIEVERGLQTRIPAAGEVSRFPQVRRDLAVVVDESITFSALRERVVLASPDALRAVRVFDVYTGKSVEKGRKSIALGLIYQDFSRTLTDSEADAAVLAVAQALSADLNARVRE